MPVRAERSAKIFARQYRTMTCHSATANREWGEMRNSAIRTIVTARLAPIAAAAFVEHIVQIWNWETGEQLSEIDTVFEHGGHRLALSPTAASCVAASWNRGKRDGVACYDARSGQIVWRRPDLRRVQGLRFSTRGDAIWCSVEGGPVQRLDAATGVTAGSLRAVQDVVDSPYSDHLLKLRRKDFLIDGLRSICIPRLTFAMLDAVFCPDALCLSEATGPVRCVDLETGNERWRYQPPNGHQVLRIFTQADQPLYGVQWGYEHGGSLFLIRLSPDTGTSTVVSRLDSFSDACCFGAGVVVTSSGNVVSLLDGTILRHLAFPQRDYPEMPAPVREPLLHFATRFGTVSTIERLVADGADVNLPDDAGSTPLHIAAMRGRLDVVRILLNAGADPYKRNSSAETPAEVADRAGFSEVAQCLKR